MNRIEFVAVVYNNYIDTSDFIESINALRQSYVDISCVIVDNSDDAVVRERIDKLASIYGFLRVLRPPFNLGYFGAFNFYFAECAPSGSDVIVLCNNDLIFSIDFVENFRSTKYYDDIYVVCPDVVTLDGVHQNPHSLRRRSHLQILKFDLYFSAYSVACLLRIVQRGMRTLWKIKRKRNPAPAGYLHMGVGACYILLPVFFSKFRKLDFPHFLYGEEVYLTNQVHSVGGKLYYDPELKVRHKESATLSKLPARTTYDFARKGYWSYRNLL